jgi:cell division protein FtsI/penicillin-binding protein 2
LTGLQLLLAGFGVLVVLRMGYIQLVQHGHYVTQAANEHLRKYEVPAARGQIFLRDGDTKVPLTLNQTLKLVYADPSIVVDPGETARKLAEVTGQPADKYAKAIAAGGEYVVLETKVKDDLARRIRELRLHGIGMVDEIVRNYPEGSLASQVLGFVNGEGKGQYGVEAYLDKELRGQVGQLNAKTDTNGVPIATTDNLSKAPVDGDSVVLTLDRNIQAQAETFLKEGVESVKADSGSVVVMDPRTGAVKAMANYPTFDPNQYGKVKDYHQFENMATGNAFEPGSGFKVITMAAGLDTGKVHKDTTFDDTTGCLEVDKHKICNADGHKGGPAATMTVVLRDSLNTGVMFILRQLGTDPNAITKAGKQTLYDYIDGHFQFGHLTGIEQQGEAIGVINKPTSNTTNYANMTFGQGLSTTMIQMTAAVGAIANGGTLYKPYLVEERLKADGTTQKTRPQVARDKVISKAAATELTEMMEVVVQHGSGYKAATPGYRIAGKTGTAQIPDPNGGYIKDRNIGTFVGFAPAEAPKFVVMVRVNKPQIQGFAEVTTVPVFANLTRWLLQYYAVPPSS